MDYIKENASLYKKVLKLIKKYNTIVVYRHEMPDFDASGTQNGLVTWLKDSFPNKKIYAQGKDFYDFTLDDFRIEDYQAGEQITNIPIAI